MRARFIGGQIEVAASRLRKRGNSTALSVLLHAIFFDFQYFNFLRFDLCVCHKFWGEKGCGKPNTDGCVEGSRGNGARGRYLINKRHTSLKCVNLNCIFALALAEMREFAAFVHPLGLANSSRVQT